MKKTFTKMKVLYWGLFIAFCSILGFLILLPKILKISVAELIRHVNHRKPVRSYFLHLFFFSLAATSLLIINVISWCLIIGFRVEISIHTVLLAFGFWIFLLSLLNVYAFQKTKTTND